MSTSIRRCRSGMFLVAALTMVVAMACGGLTGGGDIDPAELQDASAEGLGRKLLKRFETTIDVEALSVEVEQGSSGPRALRFDYFTPVGDKHFTIPIKHDVNVWKAEARDVVAAEKKFSR